MRNTERFLSEKSYLYRKRFIELFSSLGFGHLTSAFSWTEIATVLYWEFIDISHDNIKNQDQNKLFVSKGHGIGMLFPIFEDLGLITGNMGDIVKIGGDNTKIRELVYPGWDFYGGSLGIGLGMAAGMAKGKQLSGSQTNVYCIVGDAETYEGSIWEAINFAGHQKLSNLIVILDRNGLGVTDFTENMLRIEPISERWSSFGWETKEINGHDVKEIYCALAECLSSKSEKPKCIVANTKKGYGLDYVIDKPLMHGYIPKGDEIEKALRELKR